jgi:ABC-2 type transport system ATP-binding protein
MNVLHCSTTAICAQGLRKTFRTYKKEPGLAGAFKGLFRRTYSETVAVDDVSFEIQQGEIVGFLGPNGAGKTTTLKMLAGLIHPTSGSATVLGHLPWKRENAYRRQFALLLGQKNQLWWDLPAYDSLKLNARIYGIPDASFCRTVAELSELLLVTDQLDVMVRELSLGERMKMELIAALLHNPKVLFLDEPTIGLDLVAQKTIREFLQEFNASRRTTILLTSHYTDDIEALCRRVIIIDHGKVFFDGALAEMLDRFAGYKLLRIHAEEKNLASLLALDGAGEVVESCPYQVTLKIQRDRAIATCKTLLDRYHVTDFEIQEVPVEDVIREIFTRRSADSTDRFQTTLTQSCAP